MTTACLSRILVHLLLIPPRRLGIDLAIHGDTIELEMAHKVLRARWLDPVQEESLLGRIPVEVLDVDLAIGATDIRTHQDHGDAAAARHLQIRQTDPRLENSDAVREGGSEGRPGDFSKNCNFICILNLDISRISRTRVQTMCDFASYSFVNICVFLELRCINTLFLSA